MVFELCQAKFLMLFLHHCCRRRMNEPLFTICSWYVYVLKWSRYVRQHVTYQRWIDVILSTTILRWNQRWNNIEFGKTLKVILLINHNASEIIITLFLYTYFSYKQLGSDHIPQSWLYFQGFWGSKILNGSLVVLPSHLCLREI